MNAVAAIKVFAAFPLVLFISKWLAYSQAFAGFLCLPKSYCCGGKI
jgi:hypothetical protein